MRRISIVTFVTAALFTGVMALSAVSCAKAEVEDSTKLQQMAFEAWVEKYVTGKGIEAVRQSNGMYVEFLEDGDQNIETSSDTVMWLRLDYTARDISGNVFATRDSMEALRQRTFSPLTYYVPDYVFCGPASYGMSAGRHFALRNELVKADGSTVKMSRGSQVKLYMPPYLAYGASGYSDYQGYGGQYPLGDTKIVVEDLSVADVIKNPIEREEKLVNDYATTEWGLALTDTLAACLYVDTLFTPSAELLERFPVTKFSERDTLGTTTEAKIWFIGRFMPTEEYPEGFLFDSNIETVYNKFYNRRIAENYVADEVSFASLNYTPESDKDDFLPAFYKVIPALRRGQWARIVFTSAYGYGATGMSAALQRQQQEQQAYMDAYYDAYMYQNMMYGSGYYDNYGMNSYYNGGLPYYNYSPSSYSESEENQQIMTEVQPYTPLIFEIYIEPEEDDYL